MGHSMFEKWRRLKEKKKENGYRQSQKRISFKKSLKKQ